MGMGQFQTKTAFPVSRASVARKASTACSMENSRVIKDSTPSRGAVTKRQISSHSEIGKHQPPDPRCRC
jgi:hypothetical protein